MKLLLITLLLLASIQAGLSQGTVQFYNRVVGVVVAPVYGVNPVAPSVRMSGNATTNGGPVDYTGVTLLTGTGYTASMWAARTEVTDVNQFQLLATTPFRTFAPGAGFWEPPCCDVVVSVIPVGDRLFNAQVRVWDNQNGTIISWAQALANPTVGGMGYSEILVLPVHLPPAPAAQLEGLTSFNLTVVPEPSALALGLLCATTLWLARRHRHREKCRP